MTAASASKARISKSGQEERQEQELQLRTHSGKYMQDLQGRGRGRGRGKGAQTQPKRVESRGRRGKGGGRVLAQSKRIEGSTCKQPELRGVIAHTSAALLKQVFQSVPLQLPLLIQHQLFKACSASDRAIDARLNSCSNS